jgi:hypothetical protein
MPSRLSSRGILPHITQDMRQLNNPFLPVESNKASFRGYRFLPFDTIRVQQNHYDVPTLHSTIPPLNSRVNNGRGI